MTTIIEKGYYVSKVNDMKAAQRIMGEKPLTLGEVCQIMQATADSLAVEADMHR